MAHHIALLPLAILVCDAQRRSHALLVEELGHVAKVIAQGRLLALLADIILVQALRHHRKHRDVLIFDYSSANRMYQREQ